MPGHQKQDRGSAEPYRHGIIDTPWSPKVGQQIDDSKQIAQKACENSESDDRLIFFKTKDVICSGHYKTCRRKRDTTKKSPAEEQAPGVLIGSIGDSCKAVDKAHCNEGQPNREYETRHNIKRSNKRFYIFGPGHAHQKLVHKPGTKIFCSYCSRITHV